MYVLEADIIIKKNIYFFQNMFQMTAITSVSLLNHYLIIGLYIFWDTVFM